MDDRRQKIFQIVVEEYIKSAEPISSNFINENYDFGVSPATIRAELALLEEDGYLAHPHTSSGRIPTEKGYRFFVDNLNKSDEFSEKDLEQEEILQKLKRNNELFDFLARSSHSLILSLLRKRIYESGLREVLEEPEFSSQKEVIDLIGARDFLRENLEKMQERFKKSPQILIGSEAEDLIKSKDFAIISVKRGEIAFIFVGPMRMRYNRILSLLEKF